MEYSFTVWAYRVENKILPLAMLSAGCEQLEFVKSENVIQVSVVSLIQLHSPRKLTFKIILQCYCMLLLNVPLNPGTSKVHLCSLFHLFSVSFKGASKAWNIPLQKNCFSELYFQMRIKEKPHLTTCTYMYIVLSIVLS